MIEIPVIEYVNPYIDINKQAQLATKYDYPWWWDKHGCSGTVWYPLGEECRDLTEMRQIIRQLICFL